MGVFLEGKQVDIVSPAAKTVVLKSYDVTIGDGQLSLGLKDLGGKDKSEAIEGLTVMLLPPAINLVDILSNSVAAGEGEGSATASRDRAFEHWDSGAEISPTIRHSSMVDDAMVLGPLDDLLDALAADISGAGRRSR